MAVRQLVTGSDVCAPSDGSGGPANAASALADQLLGRTGKAQERLRELPGANLPPAAGPSAQGPIHAPSVADAARALATGDAMRMWPGEVTSQRMGHNMAEEFLGLGHGVPPRVQSPLHPQFGGSRQHTHQPHANSAAAAAPMLQAFVNSGKLGREYKARSSWGIELTVAEQLQVRDRSTIIGRQIYGDHGMAYADAQVANLLQSLNIDPSQLAHESNTNGDWDALFNRGAAPGAQQMAATRNAAPQWAQDFSLMRLDDTAPRSEWHTQFAAQQQQQQQARLHHPQQRHQQLPQPQQQQQQATLSPGDQWAGEFDTNTDTDDWSSEFRNHQDVAAVEGADWVGAAAPGPTDVLEHTRALHDTLSADRDPKFQNSKFLQFLSKMTQGDIVLEDNQVKEVHREARSPEWAEEFDVQPSVGGSNGLAQDWASAFEHHHAAATPSSQQQPQTGHWANMASSQQANWSSQFAAQNRDAERAAVPLSENADWSQEFGRQSVAEGVEGWADQIGRDVAADVGSWADQFDTGDWSSEFTEAAASAAQAGLPSNRTRQEGYQFAAENPYTDDADSFAKAKHLFRRGVLSEAVLALEAEVARRPDHTDAWRLLGTAHAENEDDLQAIAAMDGALRSSPSDLEVLLSLGVSHTNEMDAAEARGYLGRWLRQHPQHGSLATEAPLDSSQRHSHLVRQFEAAAMAAPAEADLQVALGVLHNLGRSYDAAVSAFRNALTLRPADYSLWNKLGATLANSNRSREAVAAYQRALELKPNYMRAWANMGIAQANLGSYDASARFYIRALGLNPSAHSVWGYLRTSLACAGRLDVMPLLDAEDLSALQEQLPLT